MLTRVIAPPSIGLLVVTVAMLAMPRPASAQATGMVQGAVRDGKGEPVADATITITLREGITRRFTTTSQRDGSFRQLGLPPGRYRVTAEKTGVGFQEYDVSVSAGQAPQVNFVLVPGKDAGRVVEEDPAKAAAFNQLFDAAVTDAVAGRHDDAITKYRQALDISPRCHQCYHNMGVSLTHNKAYPEAEEAFQKAIDLKIDYAEAYNGLAAVYNAQRRFDDARTASQEAAKHSGGVLGVMTGSNQSVAVYGEAIALWNAGKIDDAMRKFEEVIKLQPDHAEAHYWLGMAHLNRAQMPDAVAMLERYLALAPDGENAPQARSVITHLKK